MQYTVFNQNNFDATKEDMFLGQNVNVSRFDKQKYPFLEKLTEKQMAFFWQPHEVDLSKDASDFKQLSSAEQHIFTSNLKYQTLLDSVQGRSPNIAFLPLVSLPELESWIEVWSFEEMVHSRSYTHIIRNVYNDPSIVLDDIVANEAIMKRASAVSKYYDDLIAITHDYYEGRVSKRDVKKSLYLCLMAVNVLEAIRFYVSFACSFAFAERAIMEGNAKIIALIARSEALHMSGTQMMLNTLKSGKEGQEWVDVVNECKSESVNIFKEAVNQEKDWADYLFKDGSMLGLNADILKQYVDHLVYVRASAVGLGGYFTKTENPIPWINSRLVSDAVISAPQETESTTYLTGAIDGNISDDEFGGFDL